MTIAGEQAIQALDCFEAVGVRSDASCARLGLTRAALTSPGNRLSRILFDSLFLAAADLGDDPLVGLHAGMAKAPADLLFFVALSQPTLGDAVHEWARLSRTVDDSLVARVVERGDTVCLRLTGSMPTSAEAQRHQLEFFAGQVVQYVVLATKGAARVAGVRFPHPPAAAVTEYERTLGVAVMFRHTAFEIHLRTADLPVQVVTANPDIRRLTRDAAEQQLRAAETNSFRARVESALRRRIHDAADHSREGVAELLATSVSTLQRRLRGESCSFRDVRDHVRRTVAEDLLANGQQSVSEIAELLDFADVASFGKAFRRWTGASPRDFRARGSWG